MGSVIAGGKLLQIKKLNLVKFAVQEASYYFVDALAQPLMRWFKSPSKQALQLTG